jgi:arginyl-tRNA synthetase
LRKSEGLGIAIDNKLTTDVAIAEKEQMLIQLIASYPTVVKEAGDTYSPAVIANYIYELVKEYNQFYHEFYIIREENEALRHFRLVLSKSIAQIIKSGMSLLGIVVPERM